MMPVADVPPAVFLPPTYANDSDAVDDDVYLMRCESIGCALLDWLVR